MISRRALIAALLILGLAVASSWLSRETTKERLATERKLQHTPDFFLENFSATSLDNTGTPKHRLEAEHLEHYPDDDSTELRQLHLVLFRKDAPPWHIHAARGRSQNDDRLIQLDGGVRLVRQGADSIELRTDNMRIKPHEQYAETDAPLTITTAQAKVEAVGMRAHIGERRFVLMSNVRGIYYTVTK